MRPLVAARRLLESRRAPTWRLLSIVLVALAIAAAALVFARRRPETDDAAIAADVVHVAPEVGGRIADLPVHENDFVHKGDVLLRLDPVPYQLAVDLAAANLDIARAALESQRRLLAIQRAAADIDTMDGAQASVRAASAVLANARRALDDTAVRAPHDGRVVGLSVSTGEVVRPAQSLFTLINTEEWFAVANLRESDLDEVAVGDCVTVYSMLDGRRPLKGRVQGIGWGVAADGRDPRPRADADGPLPLAWARAEHRFPVRIRLQDPPPGLMRLGASADVQVRHGAACG